MIAPRYCEMNVETKNLSSPFKTPYSSTIGFGYLRGIKLCHDDEQVPQGIHCRGLAGEGLLIHLEGGYTE